MTSPILPDSTDIATRVAALEEHLCGILARNQRVETQKSWERSRTRLICVTIITYVTMILVFAVLESPRPLLDALVPTTGFFFRRYLYPSCAKFGKGASNNKP